MNNNISFDIEAVSIYFDKDRITIAGWFNDPNGPSRGAGDPIVLSADINKTPIGASVREMYHNCLTFTLCDVNNGKDKPYTWTKATKIKSWKQFVKKHEMINIEWNKHTTVEIAHSQKEFEYYSYEHKSVLDKIILPNTAKLEKQ